MRSRRALALALGALQVSCTSPAVIGAKSSKAVSAAKPISGQAASSGGFAVQTNDFGYVAPLTFVEPAAATGEFWFSGVDYQSSADASVPVWLASWDTRARSFRPRLALPAIPRAGSTTLQAVVARVGDNRLIVAAGNRGWNSGGPVFLGAMTTDGGQVAAYRRIAEDAGAPVIASNQMLVALAWKVGLEAGDTIHVASLDSEARILGEFVSRSYNDDLELYDFRAAGLAVLEDRIYVAEPGTHAVRVRQFDGKMNEVTEKEFELPRLAQQTPVALLSAGNYGLLLSLPDRILSLNRRLETLESFTMPSEGDIASEIARTSDGRMVTDSGLCSDSFGKFSCCFAAKKMHVGPPYAFPARDDCEPPMRRSVVRAIGDIVVEASQCANITRITSLH